MMPPQWDAYEIPPPPDLPPLVADRSPLDDILAQEANVPTPPPVAQGIPSNLISMVPEVPPPPVQPGMAPAAMPGEVPQPPPLALPLEPVADDYAVPEPPTSMAAPPELAPDFTAVDYARSLDAIEAGPSVDAAAAAKTAQAAEQNLTTMQAALAEAQNDVVEIAQQQMDLKGRASELDETIATLKGTKKRTPEQAAELAAAEEQRKTLTGEIKDAETAGKERMQRFNAAKEQVQIATEGTQAARGTAETALATAEREAAIQGVAAQEAGARLFAKESRKIDEEYTAKANEIEAAEADARARMDDDRKAYREALKAGPAKQSMVLTVAAVLGEALAARSTGRPPDFGRVIGQLTEATKGEFNERVQRQLSLIAEGEDSLAKTAQERRVLDAQRAAQKAEILATIEMDIQEKMLGARGTVREAELAMAAGDVRKAKEAALQEAMNAQAKARAAELKAQGDLALQQAQIRKANAEAAEKEAEAAKKAGLGGKRKAEAWSARDPAKVYIPLLDTELASFEGQPNAAKRAKEAGAMVTSGFQYLKALNEYEALLEDYGSRKLMDKSGWTESDEYRDLSTHHAQLKTALAKVIAGQGFSTTESDLRAAESMTPLPTAWNDTSKTAVARMRKNGEDQLRITLSQSLDTRAQEKLIREVGRFGTSRRDMQRSLVNRAGAVLQDADKPVETRLAAIAALSENIRKGLKSEGEQAERDAILAEIQEIRNAKTRILETEYDPENPIDGVTDAAYEVVRALNDRQRELRKIWDGIGKAGSKVTEQAIRDKQFKEAREKSPQFSLGGK